MIKAIRTYLCIAFLRIIVSSLIMHFMKTVKEVNIQFTSFPFKMKYELGFVSKRSFVVNTTARKY